MTEDEMAQIGEDVRDLMVSRNCDVTSAAVIFIYSLASTISTAQTAEELEVCIEQAVGVVRAISQRMWLERREKAGTA